MTTLDVMASLVHLKVTYHNNFGKPIVLDIDVKSARRTRNVILENLFTIISMVKEGLRGVNMVNLHMREDEVKPILDRIEFV